MNQFLSQEEVDALLRGITEGDVVTEQSAGDGDERIRPYDLTNQERIIRGRMPTLEIIIQKFARLLRASLSGNLRRVIDVGAQNVEMVKFGEFLKTLPVPTSMHIIRMNPWRAGPFWSSKANWAFGFGRDQSGPQAPYDTGFRLLPGKQK